MCIVGIFQLLSLAYFTKVCQAHGNLVYDITKAFYLAVRWLMSLKPWQSIKCYNLIVFSFPAISYPPYPWDLIAQKRELGMGWKGNRIDVKKNRLWLDLEIIQIKQTKAQNLRALMFAFWSLRRPHSIVVQTTLELKYLHSDPSLASHCSVG